MSADRQPASGGHAALAFDLAFPPVPLPSPGVLAFVDETLLRNLVKRHHERLRDSSIGNLFPADPQHFSSVVDKIATFIVKTLAGPSAFSRAHGHSWLRTAHFPLTIDETARNVWLAEMLGAFDDVGFPDEARAEYWNWVEALSILLINRRTMITQPRRYPFAEAPKALRPFMGAGRGK